MTTKTTTHLKLPSPSHWLDLSTPTAAAGICIFILLVIAALVGRVRSGPSVATVPLAPIIIVASPLPVQPRLVAPVPAQQIAAVERPATRWITAFASPDGAVLGPIPWSVERAILGRFGDGWILTNWENGQVWIRAADLGVKLENLAPAIAQPAAPQPAQQAQPPYQVSNQPEPPAQPPAQAPEPPAQPAAAPVVAPQPAQQAQPTQQAQPPSGNLGHDTDVEAEWARVQWRSTHCYVDTCWP